MDTSPSESTLPSNKKFQCPRCDDVFEKKDKFNRHLFYRGDCLHNTTAEALYGDRCNVLSGLYSDIVKMDSTTDEYKALKKSILNRCDRLNQCFIKLSEDDQLKFTPQHKAIEVIRKNVSSDDYKSDKI